MAECRGNDKFVALEKLVLLGILPRARARSAATLGFSAMTRAFGMLLNFHEAAAGKLLDQLRISRASKVKRPHALATRIWK